MDEGEVRGDFTQRQVLRVRKRDVKKRGERKRRVTRRLIQSHGASERKKEKLREEYC